MSLESRLDTWVKAGLIDQPAADRIRAYEAGTSKPTVLWAIAGLGLLALLLGIILVISANWDMIPAAVKLGAHMALMAGAAAAFWWAREQGRLWISEAALFLFAGLVLAGIALQAQVYQLTGPAWEAFLMWLALAGPALLIAGRTRLTGLAFVAAALIGPTVMAVEDVDEGGLWLLAQGAAMAVPATLVLLSFLLDGHRSGFRLTLRETGLVTLIGGASIAHFAWASNITGAQAMDNAVRLILPAIASAAAILVGRRQGFPRPLLLPMLAGPVLAFALALAIPHADHTASRLIGVAIFIAMWVAVAQGAAQAGWNGVFAVAIAAIGIRIFIIYIELFGSLAATGGGLILGGLLLVGLSYIWHRLVQRRTHAKSGEAA
ncbi:DUF2157 domain-containing protein [Sandaracinobacteroides hominis]|uniref:DUF2157 domain-containing protein n=1 Tax=Sandaracinobacteroides hominis TaxID=2780086 RepID=UPI0018F4A46B|nr:DUF2157 domain-containing protein [Sandaracinobacteroides hominis]